MKLLIIGGGGREHALCWRAAQSEMVAEIYVAPGNAGTVQEPKTQNVNIATDDLEGLVYFAKQNSIDLCIVGPETPLVFGITDLFNQAGIKCFGPNQAAAQLEGSKAFTKAFLQRHQIPTADYVHFTDYSAAVDYVKSQSMPVVIKADGLAAGKGVIIAQDEAQAVSALGDIMQDDLFGAAGASVVIEAFLQGEEASFICMVAGTKVLPLASSQDHKAAYDGDKGPNTGGMGAYSPAPIVDQAMQQKIMATIIQPTVEGLKADGIDYTGFLFAGIMIDKAGIPRVIEFNCRLGDPETQAIMMRLESDIVALCLAALNGELPAKAHWREEVAVGVVLAAKGYPAKYNKGHEITFAQPLTTIPGVKVFHAGTKMLNSKLVTSGGRILCVCALASNTQLAQALAYRTVQLIDWQGMWCRADIAYRAIARET